MKLLAHALVVLLALGSVACSASSAEAMHPQPGPMPPGASWQGFYQGPYHLGLNIWAQGNQVVGNWRAIGDREGEFSGTTFGNLLILNFNEHGAKNAERYSGRGYFVYSVPKSGEPHQIYGEWGVGKTDRSTPWWATKRGPEPRGKGGFAEAGADDQDQNDDVPGCEMGNCDTQDTETQ
jgi:hypothetical protein